MKHEDLLIALESLVTKLDIAFDYLDDMDKHNLESTIMNASVQLNNLIDKLTEEQE